MPPSHPTARTRVSAFALACACCCAASAGAATLSGTVSASPPGTGPFEVRLWTQAAPPKGSISITATQVTDASGAYSFKLLGPGTYLIDARGTATSHTNLGDRWYDVAQPFGSGYVGEDADRLVVVTGAETFAGLDLVLDVLAGLDGTVSGANLVGQFVRAESTADVRVHHNAVTKDVPHLAEYSFRGLVPGAIRVFAHDPLFRQDDSGLAAIGVSADAVGVGPVLNLPALPVDGYEGGTRNDTFATGANLDTLGACSGASGGRCFGLPGSLFDSASQGRTPYLGPINPSAGTGDVDFYCWSGLKGDRYLITAQAPLARSGSGVENPWVDPTVSFWVAGTQVLADDDSLGNGYRSAGFIDTTGQRLAADARTCVAVSTFGDVGFSGQGNQSGGRYQVLVKLGNRQPAIAASPSVDGVEKATPVVMDEAQTLTVALVVSDPDSAPDTLTLGVRHTDRNGARVSGGTLTRLAGTASWVWPTTQTTANLSPYTVTFTVGDGEYTAQASVDVNVQRINVAPTQPLLLSPLNGARVASDTPLLRVLNATDVDQEPTWLDYELYVLDPQQALQLIDASAATGVPQDASGETTWTPAPLPENRRVFWRVRANDHHANDNCCSPWTAMWELLVDTANQPPPVPQMVKPGDGETVSVRAPALSATSVEDPEGDAVTLQFQLSADALFTAPATLDATPVNVISATTAQGLPGPLAWGSSWFARVRATDVRGASSDWSAPIAFQVKADAPPPQPRIVGAFEAACQDHVFTLGPPPAIEVSRVEDPDGEAVAFDLELSRFEDDPAAGHPLFGTSQPQAQLGAATAVDVSLFTAWTEGAHYRVRARANDGVLASGFAECDFRLQQTQVLDAGSGAGSDAGGAPDAGPADAGPDAGNGPPSAPLSSCGCTSAPDLGSALWLGLLLFAFRRGASRPGRPVRP